MKGSPVAKRTPVRQQDQFLVRLPDGMRERIKAKADRVGISMNEAIVWCLKQYFPAPQTLDQKINELIEMAAMLKGDDTEKVIDTLIGEIDVALRQLSDKKLIASPNFREAVIERYDRYLEEEQENLRDLHENPFDDADYLDPDPQLPSDSDPATDPFFLGPSKKN